MQLLVLSHTNIRPEVRIGLSYKNGVELKSIRDNAGTFKRIIQMCSALGYCYYLIVSTPK